MKRGIRRTYTTMPTSSTSVWVTTTSALRARVDGADRERLVAFDTAGIEEHLGEAAAESAVLSFGGSVIAGPELSTTWMDWDTGFGRAFTVRRRSSTPDDDYIARYAGI